MSSAVVSTPAALGRPFVFDPKADSGVCSPSGVNSAVAESSPLARLQSAIKNQQSKISPARVTPASQLDIRPAPEMASSGAPAIDALTGGLPRGCLTEICGPASSGRTTLLLAALAAATRRGEFCVVVDASDALDPHSAAAAGVELDRLLWVRCGEEAPQKPRSKPEWSISRAPFAREACPELVERVGTSSAREMGVHSQPAFDFDQAGWKENVGRENGWKENASRQSEHRLEQVLRATDLLLESGGFGLIVLDLGDLPPQSARHIPLTTWFRFRRAVEYTPTILLALEQQAIAGSCSSLLLKLGASDRLLSVDESAAQRRQNAAHGVSRGLVSANEQAPEGRKRMDPTAQTDYPAHTQLLTGLNITAELIRSRLDRKPAHSVAFATKTAWAG